MNFGVPLNERRYGHLAGCFIASLGKRQPHNALASPPETLSPERSVHNRSEIALLCPTDSETVTGLNGCYAHNTTDPQLDKLTSGETPNPWMASTRSPAAGGTEGVVPAMIDNIEFGAEPGLVVGESASVSNPDVCLVSEYHARCVEANS